MANIAILPTERNPRYTRPTEITSNRHNSLLKEAGHLRSRGWDEDEIVEELHKLNHSIVWPSLTGGEFRKVERRVHWICGNDDGPRQRREEGYRAVEIAELLSRAQSHVSQLKWTGVFGRTCHQVMVAMLGLMQSYHRDLLSVDVRTLAELTGYGSASCARALSALSGRDKKHKTIPILLTHEKPKERALAHLYILRNIPDTTDTCDTFHTPVSSVCTSSLAPTHDAFRGRKGLSKTCKLIYEMIGLFSGYQTFRQIALAGNVSRHTVRCCVKQLESAGLVTKKKSWEITDLSLDVVALRRGSAGHLDRQRKEHAHQREQWKIRCSRPMYAKNWHLKMMRRFDDAPQPVWEDIAQAA